MGIFSKGPLQSPRQAKKAFDRLIKEEVDDKRKPDKPDELAARRQQKKGGR